MIRSFGSFSALLAICPIGLYCSGSAVASPGGGNVQCSFVVDGPKVVNVSGVNSVMASAHAGVCTLNAHIESTICLNIEGTDSAGQCGTGYDLTPAVVYYQYRPGATYIVKGQGCADIMEGSHSPAQPSTVCQDIAATRVTL
jgi:hypothetical protein